MEEKWNAIVTENVRLLKETRKIALRDQLPPVRKQFTHKSLNEPFLRQYVIHLKQQQQLPDVASCVIMLYGVEPELWLGV